MGPDSSTLKLCNSTNGKIYDNAAVARDFPAPAGGQRAVMRGQDQKGLLFDVYLGILVPSLGHNRDEKRTICGKLAGFPDKVGLTGLPVSHSARKKEHDHCVSV